jgi:hypothetical protein
MTRVRRRRSTRRSLLRCAYIGRKLLAGDARGRVHLAAAAVTLVETRSAISGG